MSWVIDAFHNVVKWLRRWWTEPNTLPPTETCEVDQGKGGNAEDETVQPPEGCTTTWGTTRPPPPPEPPNAPTPMNGTPPPPAEPVGSTGPSGNDGPGSPSGPATGKPCEPPTVPAPENSSPVPERDNLTRPIAAGGRRNGGKSGPESGTSPAPPARNPRRVELICRRNRKNLWSIVLVISDPNDATKVMHNGVSLEQRDSEFVLSRFDGNVCIHYRDNTCKVQPLSGNKPIFFKFRNNWEGDGRKIARITKGHFIGIAHCDRKRTGPEPVECEECVDPNFMAHYFFCDPDTSTNEVGGFVGYNKGFGKTHVTLKGESVFDDSGQGTLFRDSPPSLCNRNDVSWVRVGEERKGGWGGKNFKPNRESSLQDILEDREGRFFVRIYDDENSMLDSADFRYLKNLKAIRVNGKEYNDSTILSPSPNGYRKTRIEFVNIDDSIIPPVLQEPKNMPT